MTIDPLRELQEAVTQLHQLLAPPSPRQKIFALFKAAKHAPQDNHKIQSALKKVEKHAPLIEELDQGTPQDQKLARSAKQALKSYKQWLGHRKQHPPGWSHRVAKFLRQVGSLLRGIDAGSLPKRLPSKVTPHNPGHKTPSNELIHPAIQQTAIKQHDLFRMKVIVHLHTHKILPLPTALKLVKEASIQTQTPNSPEELSFSLNLCPKPGSEFKITGSSRRDPRTGLYMPDQKSFTLSATDSSSPQ